MQSKLAWILLLAWRKKKAMQRLYARLGRNAAVQQNLGVCVSVASIMGAGKNRFEVDLIMDRMKAFKNQALDIMLEIDRLFPNFDFQAFEDAIERGMSEHTIYNVYTAERYARNVVGSFERYLSDDEYRRFYDKAMKRGKVTAPLYGYDFETYPLFKNTGVKIEDLTECLVDYAKAYYIYSVDSTLIYSNYAISLKTRRVSGGNLPYWDFRFLAEPSLYEPRMQSHIIDYDMLRLGKHMDEDGAAVNVYEFGGIALSELDKERGNMLDTNELKKFATDVNQKNDNFNGTPKMGRHICNIRNRSFFFMIADMQRINDINAAFQQNSDRVTLERESEPKLLLPFFNIEELLYNLFLPFDDKYFKYRVNRGDETLMMYLLKKIAFAVRRHHDRAYNLYSCMEQVITVNDVEKYKYYIIPRKVYADVYSTDLMSGFFKLKSSKSALGILDIPVYQGKRATVEELKLQHSYMVNGWLDGLTASNRNDK